VIPSTQEAPPADEHSTLRLRQAEAALAATEARLRRSQQLGGAHPYEWSLTTNKLIAYPGLGQLYGLEVDEPVTYDTVTARIHPEDRLRVRTAHLAAVKSGGPYQQEYRVVLPTGAVRWIMARGEALMGDDGETVALAGVVVDITQRKETELVLRQREAEFAASERRFRVLANAMPQMVWFTRPDGYHDYYNQRWYDFTGMPEGSTDGEEWNGMFHPDDRERAWKLWRHSLESGEPYEIEYRLRHRSGEYRWVLGRASPIRDEQGVIERWFGTCTDIHDLKQVEQALAESEEFTRRLLSSSDDCIKVLDLDGALRFMSEGGQRVMEVSDFCQIEGADWLGFWNGPAAQEARAAVDTARAGGTGRFQGFCPTAAGAPKWWDVLVTVIKGPDGRPERLLSISRDITEMKQAEDLAAQTAERYRLASRATNDAIWDWDLATDHIQWNEAVQTLFGYAPEDVGPSGKWWKRQIHPDDRERVAQDIQTAIDGEGTHWSAEYRFQRADGTYATIFDRGHVLRDETGQAIRMIGAMLDISDRKQAEQQLRLLHRELGHRLKNVLTMVQAIASQTLRSSASLDEARETLAARLITMGKAQDVLIDGTADEADVATVLASALEPHGWHQTGRFRLRGPRLRLNSGSALSLALLVHELATNAIKYGALSVPDGHVDLVWAITEDEKPCLALRWSEHGGPPVVVPARKGFGTRLITRGLGGDGRSQVQLDYEPSGVVCTLTAPLEDMTGSD